MPGILFMCPDSAGRGPMAEAITRHLAPHVEAWSVARYPGHVRRGARAALREEGIDANGLRARGVFEVDLQDVVLVVTLAELHELPALPTGIRHVHHPLPDPDSAPDSESDEAWCDARDALLRLIPRLLRTLN